MANLNITVARGADWSKVLTFRDKLGVAVDISASTFTGQMKKTGSGTGADFTFEFDTDGTDGKIRMTMTTAETLTQSKSGNYRYDVFADILGRDYRVLWGTVDFQPNITNRP